jgi:small subunit ribosomal protein S6
MEKLYNTIFIVDISQNPDESETVTSRIQQLIEDYGGIIKKVNRWGKRRLTYPIANKSHGFYVEIEFSANSRLNIPNTLEGEFRINDRVLRHMTYIIDKKELIQREKNAGKIQRAEANNNAAKAQSSEVKKSTQPAADLPAEPELDNMVPKE